MSFLNRYKAISLNRSSQACCYSWTIPKVTYPKILIILATVLLLLTQLHYITTTQTTQLHQHHEIQTVYISPTARDILDHHNCKLNHNPRTRSRFVVYRALGNSLPPRHSSNQTYENLFFTLQNEPNLPGAEKRWYVNRILDAQEEARILELLLWFNQTVFVDSINWDHYRKLQHRIGDYINDPLRSKHYPRKSSRQLGRVRDSLLHDKNLYVMNNNGARNAMLNLGFAAGAEYVLPFDGNVFLSLSAWRGLIDGVQREREGWYFVVPMARVLTNREAIDDHRENATEEPQILFRKGAKHRFDERMRYGRQSKVELLRRLGVLGVWTNVNKTEEEKRVVECGDCGKVRSVGWCVRLSDGAGDHKSLEDVGWREENRSEGVERALGWADWYAFGLDNNTVLFDERILESLRKDFRNGSIGGCAARILEAAKVAEGLTNDYCGEEGVRRVSEDVSVLAVAGFIASNNTLSRRAAELVETFSDRTESCINAKKLARRVLPAVPLVVMLEGTKLLQNSHHLRAELLQELRSWFRGFQGLLEAHGWEVEDSGDGVWYDVLAGYVGAFVSDYRMVVRAGSFARLRLNDVEDVLAEQGRRALAWRLLQALGRRIGIVWEFGIGLEGLGEEAEFCSLFK